jgi:hypothetical protein
MKIEDKIDQTRGDWRVSHTVHRREKKTLILALYHVMNNTCIHESGAHIYICTRGEEYTKNPIKNIIIERLHISKKVLRRIEDSLWLNYSVTRLNKK